MSVTRSRVVAFCCLGATVLAEVAAVVLSWHLRSPYDAIMFAVYDVTLAAVGALLMSRLPHNPVGWILCLFGTQGALTSELAFSWGLRAVEEGWAGGRAAQWVGLVSWAPGALMWVLALLYTPTGRLPGPRWRVAVWAGVAGTAAYVLAWPFSPSSVNGVTGEPNHFVVDWLPAQEIAGAGAVLLCLSAVAALASLVVRYRMADQLVRQQLKWVGLAAAMLAVLLPVGVSLWSSSPVVQALSPLLLLTMAMAVCAAMLRYRLFDIDSILIRSATYACVSVLVVAVYAGISVSLGIALGRSSAWQVAVATLVAAVVFRPALRAVRLLIDRRFDRDAHAARLKVDAFLDGLRSGTEQPDRIQEVLRDALHEPRLQLLLYLPSADGYVDLRGRPAQLDPDLAAVRVERAGVQEAVAQYPDGGDPARPARVHQLLERASLALQVARLSVELTRRLDELDRSRSRIAEAADEERRRIQRDLHDGAQQRLVTVGIALRGVENRLRATGGDQDADRVDGLVADLVATIEELRMLSRRLPPPQLDAGIAAAFRELAGRAPIPVLVDADPDRLDRALESTAYFVGCEGLTNVIKHSRATAAAMCAVRRNGTLFVSVSDDGVGGARVQEGFGLAGLADRVAALGGRLHVESGAHGTLLTAELPCA